MLLFLVVPVDLHPLKLRHLLLCSKGTIYKKEGSVSYIWQTSEGFVEDRLLEHSLEKLQSPSGLIFRSHAFDDRSSSDGLGRCLCRLTGPNILHCRAKQNESSRQTFQGLRGYLGELSKGQAFLWAMSELYCSQPRPFLQNCASVGVVSSASHFFCFSSLVGETAKLHVKGFECPDEWKIGKMMQPITVRTLEIRFGDQEKGYEENILEVYLYQRDHFEIECGYHNKWYESNKLNWEYRELLYVFEDGENCSSDDWLVISGLHSIREMDGRRQSKKMIAGGEWGIWTRINWRRCSVV